MTSALPEVFWEHVQQQPDATALVDQHRARWTWRQLGFAVVDAIANFREQGLTTGCHVATWMENSPGWIVTDLACQQIGLVHVALDRRLPVATAVRLARFANARWLLVAEALQLTSFELSLKIFAPQPDDNGSQLHRFLPRSSEPSLQAPAQILFTSGTMEQPKAVVLSQHNLISNARAKLEAAPQHRADVRLNILPFSHAYARTCELSTWILSGSQLHLTSSWQDFLDRAPLVRPTLVNLVPHLARKLVDVLAVNPEPLGSRMRLLQVGGAALPTAVWTRLAECRLPPLQGYGLTETSPVICSNREGSQRPGTVGQPVSGVELRLDDRGVLWTRGPHVMLGYWDADRASVRTIDRDAWFCTGDLAEQVEDGTWKIIGRADDQIVLSTGYKIAPAELTRRLEGDPWIDQLVIVGENRPYVAALVYPCMERLPADILSRGSDQMQPSADYQELDRTAFVSRTIQRWQARLNDLPRWLRVEKIGLLTHRLSVDDGGLNFKGAVRRKFVEQVLLAGQVECLYGGNC